uniref:Sulphur transport domain-containing protein n=2 Tax=Guillardia theta TaxID=55529 RepID=A0A7S4NSJ1_GUITH
MEDEDLESNPKKLPGQYKVAIQELSAFSSSESQTWEGRARWVKGILGAACISLVAGVVLDLGKVVLPLGVRSQFIFKLFVMMKIVLGASAGSAYCLAGMSLVLPLQFNRVREEFMGAQQCLGIVPILVGAFILGCGMALAGGCTGKVLVQVGSGIPYSWVTLLGCFSGAAFYGIVQSKIEPYLIVGKMKSPKLEDYGPLKKVPFFVLATGLAVCMTIVIVILEVLYPWYETIPGGTTLWRTVVPPQFTGAILGILQIPAVLLLNETLGGSSAYMTYTSQFLRVCKDCPVVLGHLNSFRTGVANSCSAVALVFTIAGAAISSIAGGTYGKYEGVYPIEAFAGGFCVIFGSRLTSGCFTGHVFSGVALLSLKSMIAALTIFAGAITVGFVYFTVDPFNYTGRLGGAV